MKNSSTYVGQKRASVRMMAIVVCVIAIVATAVFGVIERVNVERRFDAIERSNQETAAALAAAASNNDLFERNYRLTVELLDAMKSMSRNMKELTVAFKGLGKTTKFRRHSRRATKRPSGKARLYHK
jgi:hypothetical protein